MGKLREEMISVIFGIDQQAIFRAVVQMIEEENTRSPDS